MKNQNNNSADKIKIDLIKQMIENAERSIQTAREVLTQIDPAYSPKNNGGGSASFESPDQSKIVEGYFNGEAMVGADGKTYPVPANYASKSKLVVGDKLKLTINSDGSFIYKQIGPIDRIRMRGNLIVNETDDYYVVSNNDYFRVLKASVTYFKAKPGDEITIIVPKGKKSGWAAIENVIILTNPEDIDISSIDFLSGVSTNKDSQDSEMDLDVDTETEGEDEPEEESSNKKTSKQRKSIIDEWMPDLEKLKQEAFSDSEDEKQNGLL